MGNFWFRMLFKLKVHESSGESFQRLFEEVMRYHNPEFEAIKPWGNWGDGGNDGWIPSKTRYFQLYAPKPNSRLHVTEIVKKAISDFDKLKRKWPSAQAYHFVFNDRYEGIPSPVAKALEKLQTQESLQEIISMECRKNRTYFYAT